MIGLRRAIFGTGLLILACAAFLIGSALVGGWRTLALTTTGRVVNGTIVDRKIVKMGAVRQTVYPIIEFTPPAGRTRRFTSQLAGSGVPTTVGEAVRVRYDATTPDIAEIDSFMSLAGPTLIRLIFAIFPVGILGAVMAWFTRFGADPADAELVKGRSKWIPGWFPP